MALIKDEDLLKDLDFKCARCQTDCTKLNALEPDLYYVSRVDGSLVGPLCKKCFDETPEKERAIMKVAETAFVIIVRPDGGGAYMMREGIELPYAREATPYDITSACKQVAKDIEDAMYTQKLMANLAGASQAANRQRKLVVPR